MSSKQYRTFNVYIVGDSREERVLQLETYKAKCDWYIGQHEVGEHGIEHIQLCFGWRNPKHKTLRWCQKNLPCGGNIQITEKPASMVKYCTDESKREANTSLEVYGEVPKFRDGNEQTDRSFDLLMEGAMATGNYHDAMKYIEENNIKVYISQRKQLGSYFEGKFAKPDASLYPIEAFNAEPSTFEDKKHKIFIGPTNIGKTQFALAHFKHPLLVRNKQDWTRYNPDLTDGIVLDDLPLRKWQSETLINTLEWDMDRTERVLYGQARVKAGTPQIICCNSLEVFWPDKIVDEHKDAIKRRVVIRHFYGPLYGNVEIPGDKRNAIDDIMPPPKKMKNIQDTCTCDDNTCNYCIFVK